MDKGKVLVRHKWKVASFLLILVALVVTNARLKLFAIHPFCSHVEGDIKVLCLNIHSTGEDFENRSLRIDSVLQTENPDFVFLTEYHDTCSMVLDSLLKERYEYRQRGIRGDFNLTECVYSKWQIDSIVDIHIDKESEKAKRYIDANPNIKQHLYHSAILRCELSKGDKKVVVYTSHLTSNNYMTDVDSTAYCLPSAFRRIERRWLAYDFGSKLRELEVEALCNDATSAECPVIVMGDMNDFCSSTCLDVLEASGMKDAWWESGLGFGCTFRDDWFRLRIDHILYSDELELVDVKVIDSDLSDHKPLMARFRFK